MSSNRARDDNDNHDDVGQLKYQRRRRRQQHTDQVKTESMALQFRLFFFHVFYRFLFRFFLLIIYLSVFLLACCIGAALRTYAQYEPHIAACAFVYERFYSSCVFGC